jgi:hypothetical protein
MNSRNLLRRTAKSSSAVTTTTASIATTTTSHHHHQPDSPSPQQQQLIRTSDAIVKHLRQLRINFVAIDFDQTLIDIHTGGVWRGTSTELVPHVRPIWIDLLTSLLQCTTTTTATSTAGTGTNTNTTDSSHNHDHDDHHDDDTDTTIHVAIVTFSKQPNMIKSVLEKVLGMEMASKIVIRGGDKSWTYQGNGSKHGKQPHMASAVEEILHQYQNNNNDNDDDVNNNNNHAPEAFTTTTSITTKPNHQRGLEINKRTTILIDDDQQNIRIALQDGVRAIWFSPNQPQQLYHDLLTML